jgi:ribosomal protein L7/L12
MVSDQDFQQLRSRMIHLEGQVEFLYKHLGVTFVPEAAPGDDPRIIELIQKGKKIDAIKIYRDLTNAGLADAKQAVEEIQRRLGL